MTAWCLFWLGRENRSQLVSSSTGCTRSLREWAWVWQSGYRRRDLVRRVRLSAQRLWTALQGLAFRAGLPSGEWTQQGTAQAPLGWAPLCWLCSLFLLSAGPCLQRGGPISWALLVFLGHSHFDHREPGSRGSGRVHTPGHLLPQAPGPEAGLSHPRAPSW